MQRRDQEARKIQNAAEEEEALNARGGRGATGRAESIAIAAIAARLILPSRVMLARVYGRRACAHAHHGRLRH